MKNKKSIKTFLFIIIALAAGLIFGSYFGRPNDECNLKLLNRNLENSINQIEMRNERIYLILEDSYLFNLVKAREWFSQAQEVRHLTKEIYNLIQEIKDKEIKQRKTTRITDKEIENLQSLLDDHTALLLYKMPAYVFYNDEQDKKRLSYDNVKQLSNMSPIAFVTALSKIQVDVKNNETEVLQYLRDMVDAGDFRVNRLEVIVIPNSNYICLGETYSAEIILAAVDTTKPPEIRVNDELINNGIYEVKPTSTGTFTYKGEMVIRRPDGTTILYPFMSSYIVGK